MKEECLICKAPLEYLEFNELMECAICHKKENSKIRCVDGHYVCNDCHTAGLDSIIGLCLEETSKNPIYIAKQMMVSAKNQKAYKDFAYKILAYLLLLIFVPRFLLLLPRKITIL